MFVTLGGVGDGTPEALALLQHATQAIQRQIADDEGHVLQFMADDKGLITLAAWGLALNAHEDDAERALRAGRALHTKLSALGLRIGIGMTTGNVFAGLLGHDRHLEYAVIGDPVNTASRIAALSSGEPLCDRATRDAAARRFEFALLEPVHVKGKAEALELHRVLGERARRSSARLEGEGPALVRSFVDRAMQREVLERRLDVVDAGAGMFLHVIGEPGVGKSSFLELVVERASARGLSCGAGAGDSLRRTDAYFAWSAILPTLLGARDLARAEDVVGALVALGLRGELAPLLNPLLPRELPETVHTAALDAAGRADLTRELLADVALTAHIRGRLLIVLDDAQWFDSASWSLLAVVQRRIPSLPIVVASRPLDAAQLPADATRVLGSPNREPLELAPLSFDDSRELMAARLAVTSISDDLARRMFERAEGHPLFTEELLLSLQQQRAIRRVEHGATLARESNRPMRMALPEGIDAVVASRIAGLDPAQQLTIKVASVIGRSFRLPTLSALRPIALPEHELAEQLDAMCAFKLLERIPGDAHNSYRFHHSIIQNVVHELLISEQQHQLHRAAAALLEREADSARTRLWALLAHHWGMAANDRKAIDYLELAAEQAWRDHALLEVVGFLREAFQRAERCPDALTGARRARWEHLLGEAEAELGLLTAAERHLAHAVAYLDRREPRTRAGLVLSLVRESGAHALLRMGRHPRAKPDRDRALAAARGYSALAAIYYNNHDLLRMLHATLSGANLALRVGEDNPTLARMLANLSIVAVVVPGVDPDDYATEALGMAERLRDAGALQEVLMVVANYEMGAARFADAATHCERAMQIARAAGEIRNWEIAAGTLANVHRLRGEFVHADRIDREVLQSGFDRSVAQTQVWGFFGRACALTHLNRIDELRELLVGFEALLADEEIVVQVSASNVVAQLLARALLSLHEEREELARASLARAVTLLDSLDHLQAYMTCTISYLHAALMGCWRRRPDCREARRWAVQADRFVERCARLFPSAAPQAHVGRGQRALRVGRPDAAARAFTRALERARANDNVFDQAHAHECLSHCAALASSEREHHARCCQRLLEGLQIEAPFAWTLARSPVSI